MAGLKHANVWPPAPAPARQPQLKQCLPPVRCLSIAAVKTGCGRRRIVDGMFAFGCGACNCCKCAPRYHAVAHGTLHPALHPPVSCLSTLARTLVTSLLSSLAPLPHHASLSPGRTFAAGALPTCLLEGCDMLCLLFVISECGPPCGCGSTPPVIAEIAQLMAWPLAFVLALASKLQPPHTSPQPPFLTTLMML